jgi:hypothetical protein
LRRAHHIALLYNKTNGDRAVRGEGGRLLRWTSRMEAPMYPTRKRRRRAAGAPTLNAQPKDPPFPHHVATHPQREALAHTDAAAESARRQGSLVRDAEKLDEALRQTYEGQASSWPWTSSLSSTSQLNWCAGAECSRPGRIRERGTRQEGALCPHQDTLKGLVLNHRHLGNPGRH